MIPEYFDALVGGVNDTNAWLSPGRTDKPAGAARPGVAETVSCCTTVVVNVPFVTVKVTGNVPDTVGVPETTPEGLHDMPEGQPDVVHTLVPPVGPPVAVNCDE